MKLKIRESVEKIDDILVFDYVGAMSSQAAIYKELINLCKEYNIPYSTFYDL